MSRIDKLKTSVDWCTPFESSTNIYGCEGCVMFLKDDYTCAIPHPVRGFEPARQISLVEKMLSCLD